MLRRTRFLSLLLFCILLIGCGGGKSTPPPPTHVFSKTQPVELSYENVSALIEDMDHFTDAVKTLDQKTLQQIDNTYQDVKFRLKEPPLFLNVYSDTAHGRVVFLLSPKNPLTGTNYELSFQKNLPIIDANTVELQFRMTNPEAPLTCMLKTADPEQYLKERETHTYEVTYLLAKRFYQSGTYDFDALRVTSYRTHGLPFLVFDLQSTEVKDITTGQTFTCK